MGTLYIDTGGSTTNSGSNDGASIVSGSAATVAGSVVSLDGSPDLSGLITSGDNQSAIYLNDATNANRKVFWITAVDNGLKQVTVDTAPTGIASSSWTIGGRQTQNDYLEGALRPGDTVIFNNSPAARSTPHWTFRGSGTAAGGFCTVKGKTGVRPVLETNGNAAAINASSLSFLWVENLECRTTHATASAISSGNGQYTFWINLKATRSDGGTGLNIIGGAHVIGCEAYNCSRGALVSGGQMYGNYIHDNGGVGLLSTQFNPSAWLRENIIANNDGYGVHFDSVNVTSTGLSVILTGCIIYKNAAGGLRFEDPDLSCTLINNVFAENGTASSTYNIDMPANSWNGMRHLNNCFYHSGVGGGANFNNASAGPTDITSDPLFTDPDNGDFTFSPSSPLIGAAVPFIGGPVSNRNIGAMQNSGTGGAGFVGARIQLGM